MLRFYSLFFVLKNTNIKSIFCNPQNKANGARLQTWEKFLNVTNSIFYNFIKP